MNLRSVNEISENSKVILRLDTDLPIKDNVILDNSRLTKSLPTIKFLLEKKCKIVIIGHRGRPDRQDQSLSLKPVYLELVSFLNNLSSSVFIDDVKDNEKLDLALEKNEIIFLENLRFWKEEENNDQNFLQNVLDRCQFFVNDAFAVAHRKNTSITLNKRIETFYGFSFIEEAEKIKKILDSPEKYVTVILGGAKEDKLNYLPDLIRIADYVLIGGKLPLLKPTWIDFIKTGKVKVAKLKTDTLDLSDEDIENFKQIISISKTIIWAGALGYYELEENRKGTNEIAKAIASTTAYKIIAGGDTSASIINLGLRDKIDFICSGGGVMLEYLTKRTLVAWED